MIPSRKIEYSEVAKQQLAEAGISEHDPRLAAAIWYFKRDPRLSLLRRVAATPSGEPLYAFQSMPTPQHPRLVVYVTAAPSKQVVTIHGCLLPTGDEDD